MLRSDRNVGTTLNWTQALNPHRPRNGHQARCTKYQAPIAPLGEPKPLVGGSETFRWGATLTPLGHNARPVREDRPIRVGKSKSPCRELEFSV